MNVSFEGKMFCSQDIEVLVLWMNSQTEYTLEVILVCFLKKKKTGIKMKFGQILVQLTCCF